MTGIRLSAAQRLAAASATLCLLAAGPAVASSSADGTTPGVPPIVPGTSESPYSYRFVSSPDFVNADVGDARKSPLHGPGDPNSTNGRYEKSLDTVMDAFASAGADDVFVAGDLVNGHWGIDTANTGIFGPTHSRAERRQAIVRAGDLYYSQWLERFEKRGLHAFPALGDHDIGDNPWRQSGARAWYARFKQQTTPLWKRNFGKNLLRRANGDRLYPDHPDGPAAETAYATRPHPEVQLISIDVFEQTATDVITNVDRQQLKWFREVLTRANEDGVDWTIVQAHTPIIGPVRMKSSSGLLYPRGASSQLWKTMRKYDVELYLAGEVHDITAHQPRKGDPVQISHGGLFVTGGTNFMVAEANGEQMSIVINKFRVSRPSHLKANRTWQTDTTRSIPAWVDYHPKTRVAGAMTLTKDGRILQRSGKLAVYRP